MDHQSTDEDPHEPPDLSPSLHPVLEIYGELNELIRRIGYNATVTVSKVVRTIFVDIMAYSDEFFNGHLVADDPKNPLGVKRVQSSVAVYTREPPTETPSKRDRTTSLPEGDRMDHKIDDHGTRRGMPC